MKKQPLLKMFDFLQVLYHHFSTLHYLPTSTFFFFTELNLKTQFEIEFLPPKNGGKKVFEKYPAFFKEFFLKVKVPCLYYAQLEPQSLDFLRMSTQLRLS